LTNYIMLELGQPLHAFDKDKLTGQQVIVRDAKPGEKLTTLNGIEHELSGQMMICDAAKPVGVPGVMGGLETEVTDATTNLLLESANFVNTVVRKTRKQLGLATEASYRFERSVDPDGVVAATKRFTELLLDAQPGIQVSNIVDLYPGKQTFAPVRLRVDRASMLLGLDIKPLQANTYLKRLGMDVSAMGDALMVVPPSWRPDIVREEDLVEELGRVHGYELIPEAYPAGSTPLGGSHGYHLLTDKLREALLRAGMTQQHPKELHREIQRRPNTASFAIRFCRDWRRRRNETAAKISISSRWAKCSFNVTKSILNTIRLQCFPTAIYIPRITRATRFLRLTFIPSKLCSSMDSNCLEFLTRCLMVSHGSTVKVDSIQLVQQGYFLMVSIVAPSGKSILMAQLHLALNRTPSFVT
jgi:hypothetical protein